MFKIIMKSLECNSQSHKPVCASEVLFHCFISTLKGRYSIKEGLSYVFKAILLAQWSGLLSEEEYLLVEPGAGNSTPHCAS